MTDALRPATDDEIEHSLQHALRFDGRKHFNAPSEMITKITAAHLLRCLRQSGFVVMKKPPAPGHSAPDYLKHLKE